MDKDLELLNKYQKEIILLSQMGALLDWDHQVYMPKDGNDSRAEELSFLSSLIHEKLTSEKLFSILNKLKKKNLSKENKIMVSRLYKIILKSRKLPKKFVEESSRVISLAHLAWVKAKKESDFNIFKPHLEKIVKLKQKEANYVKLPGHIYNSLLDDYEEGMTVEKLKPIFLNLKNELIKLLNKIESSKDYGKKSNIFNKKFDKILQMELCKDVSKRIGLDENSSRIDLTEHPFSIKIGTGDVRITTKFLDNVLSAFGSSIHESGHALYELNIPKKYQYSVLANVPSMGMHESQSRFWENMIGKSKSFWMYYLPIFVKDFKIKNNLNEIYKEINSVEKGKIRIYSDEVHYCLHIILRFEIELGLLEGKIKVKDLPEIWNKKMKEYFNVDVKNDAEGVLQDIHWSQGSFGYFPTYAIGTIYASQLYGQMKKDIPNIEDDIKKGNFTRISKWLENKIHKYGYLYLADELVKKACKTGLNTKTYINYLNKKYGEIYNS